MDVANKDEHENIIRCRRESGPLAPRSQYPNKLCLEVRDTKIFRKHKVLEFYTIMTSQKFLCFGRRLKSVRFLLTWGGFWLGSYTS